MIQKDKVRVDIFGERFRTGRRPRISPLDRLAALPEPFLDGLGRCLERRAGDLRSLGRWTPWTRPVATSARPADSMAAAV